MSDGHSIEVFERTSRPYSKEFDDCRTSNPVVEGITKKRRRRCTIQKCRSLSGAIAEEMNLGINKLYICTSYTAPVRLSEYHDLHCFKTT